MATIDVSDVIVDALNNHWSTAHPGWQAVLLVDDDFKPSSTPVVLIADDGGAAVYSGPWMLGKTLRRMTVRLTAFARDRDVARSSVEAAVDRLIANRPAGITRIEDVSDPLITRDGDTDAFLASITMPVLVRPTTS
ncbi:hypothetical protein EB72_24795 [Mycobacterium sp. SWH-M1]|nr:hypothetical protein EB72_24795 [Mycobacterium sp. SWH-M1]